MTGEGEFIGLIPARSGSKAVRCKNIRKIAGKPLIAYTIRAALHAKLINRVIVSTDSQLIADIAIQHGAQIPFLRPTELADDKTPLAAVMKHFLDWAQSDGWEIAGLVILEPTSPLRTATEIDEAIRLFQRKEVDTVISVEPDTSLLWEINTDGEPAPLQKERLNRQFMKPTFRENGAIFVTKPQVVTPTTTIGESVALYEMSPKHSVDINTYADLHEANIALRSIKILLHFKANALLGFGHFFRVLALADRLYYNDIVLICSEYDRGLENRIQTLGYRYHLTENPIEIIKQEKPQIVVNDILDTSTKYMSEIRNFTKLIVNFEDLGEGRYSSDLLFNALYEDFSLEESHYGGADYAILRDEFLFMPRYVVSQDVKTIAATFGGSDPNNIVLHVADSIAPAFADVQFRLIMGPGYKHNRKAILKKAAELENVELISNAVDMSEHLSESDIVITSGGRTVFECAACGVPTVVICQNEREMKHRHISTRDGVINLGLFHERETMPKLETVIQKLVDKSSYRAQMSERSSQIVDGLGIFRVTGLIERAIKIKLKQEGL